MGLKGEVNKLAVKIDSFDDRTTAGRRLLYQHLQRRKGLFKQL